MNSNYEHVYLCRTGDFWILHWEGYFGGWVCFEEDGEIRAGFLMKSDLDQAKLISEYLGVL